MSTDIGALQKKYARLRERRHHTHIIVSDVRYDQEDETTVRAMVSSVNKVHPCSGKTVTSSAVTSLTQERLESLTPKIVGVTKCVLVQQGKSGGSGTKRKRRKCSRMNIHVINSGESRNETGGDDVYGHELSANCDGFVNGRDNVKTRMQHGEEVTPGSKESLEHQNGSVPSSSSVNNPKVFSDDSSVGKRLPPNIGCNNGVDNGQTFDCPEQAIGKERNSNYSSLASRIELQHQSQGSILGDNPILHADKTQMVRNQQDINKQSESIIAVSHGVGSDSNAFEESCSTSENCREQHSSDNNKNHMQDIRHDRVEPHSVGHHENTVLVKSHSNEQSCDVFISHNDVDNLEPNIRNQTDTVNVFRSNGHGLDGISDNGEYRNSDGNKDNEVTGANCNGTMTRTVETINRNVPGLTGRLDSAASVCQRPLPHLPLTVHDRRGYIYTNNRRDRTRSLNFDPSFKEALTCTISADMKSNIYHNFYTKKRHLSLDSTFSPLSQQNQAVSCPFPVQHRNQNRIKAGIKLGLYKPQ